MRNCVRITFYLYIIKLFFLILRISAIFAFEIFNTGSGLSSEELIAGFGRFLFCSNYLLRERAKDNLFQLLDLDDQVDLVDGNLCIVPNDLVTKLSHITQKSNASVNLMKFTELTNILKNIDRKSLDLLRSALLQLDVMMNSSEVCQLVHDNHVWVHIMEYLGDSLIVSCQFYAIVN